MMVFLALRVGAKFIFTGLVSDSTWKQTTPTDMDVTTLHKYTVQILCENELNIVASSYCLLFSVSQECC